MNHPKTLVVILCMHRCGSSLTARLLQRLGMSLGPFELEEANESNKYGHFEAKPFIQLNRELQSRQFGFGGDMPETAEDFRSFVETDGRWSAEPAFADETIARGRELVERLMESSDVCGFKDPRTVLAWPFWHRVFAGLPEVRVVPLVLLRGPHEIAMSIFRYRGRSQGDRDYAQALDVAAVHFHRMKEILDQWSGPAPVVRFDPQVYAAEVRHAAEVCGLPWSDEALAECYDATCRHFEATVIEHPAQIAYEDLAGIPHRRPSEGDMHQWLVDAAAREALLREKSVSWQQQADAARQQADAAQQQADAAQQQADTVQRQNAALHAEIASLQQRIEAIQGELARSQFELDLIRGSRTWRLREGLIAAFRFSR